VRNFELANLGAGVLAPKGAIGIGELTIAFGGRTPGAGLMKGSRESGVAATLRFFTSARRAGVGNISPSRQKTQLDRLRPFQYVHQNRSRRNRSTPSLPPTTPTQNREDVSVICKYIRPKIICGISNTFPSVDACIASLRCRAQRAL
jgi:hypothetical protein